MKARSINAVMANRTNNRIHSGKLIFHRAAKETWASTAQNKGMPMTAKTE